MRKGQAAMEFLMTYGWAILVVLAAIGALAYFGILSPSRFLPDSYTLSGGLSQGEYKVDTAGVVTLGVINNMGTSVNITSLAVNTTGGSAITCNAGNSTSLILANGADNTWTFACGALTEGEKFKADVKIKYIKSGESVEHTITGDLTTAVEE